MHIDADLKTYALEIKTGSFQSGLGSDEEVLVGFFTTYRTIAGHVKILPFTSTKRYQLGLCRDWTTNFPTELPTDTNKVWRISLTRTSDISSIVIHCNEVEVLNILLSDSICTSDDYWDYYWSKDVEYIYFSSSDTASGYYRLKGRNIILIYV